jgi:glycosyltransferase involved in cell wall biosynthesis
MTVEEKLLIIGKLPPPIGGVTVHLARLMRALEEDQIEFGFHDLRRHNYFLLLRKIYIAEAIHLHTSNSYFRFVAALLCRCLKKKIILTFHGRLGRFKMIRNMLDAFSVRLSSKSIVLNKKSFDMARRLTENAVLVSAFLPPAAVVPLAAEVSANLKSFIGKFEILFCTNATNVGFDSSGHEIYGIRTLIELFRETPNKGLIIVDSSSGYGQFLKKSKIKIPINVKLIEGHHDFVNILKICDAYIRASTTDGDSLSVKEALYYKKQVICSDCVDRPRGCVLYETHNVLDLRDKIKELQKGENPDTPLYLSGYDSIKGIYSEFV